MNTDINTMFTFEFIQIQKMNVISIIYDIRFFVLVHFKGMLIMYSMLPMDDL